MSEALKAVSYRDLCLHWGLDQNVFDAVEARRERRLGQVMMLPNWYYEMRGDSDDTTFIVVVGARGSGKSALRRHMEEQVASEIFQDDLGGLVLTVTIDHDVRGWVSEPEEPQLKLRHFVKHIVELLTVAIVARFTRDELGNRLSSAQREQLDRHLISVSTIPSEQLDEMRKRTRSILKTVTGDDHFKKAIEIAREVRGISAPEPAKSEPQEVDLALYERDLPALVSMAIEDLGFAAIYVLVDELDEYDETQGDVRRAARLVVPLLTSRWLLEQPHLGLKFFLSEPIYFEVLRICEEDKKEIRWERSNHPEPFRLEWSYEVIKKMLSAQ
jgi:hypothetical protein